MKRTEVAGWDFPDRLKIGMMYDTDLMPFERSVAPGETFTTADVSLVLFRSGDLRKKFMRAIRTSSLT